MADTVTPGPEGIGRGSMWNLKVIVPSSSPAFKLDRWSISRVSAASCRSAMNALRGMVDDAIVAIKELKLRSS